MLFPVGDYKAMAQGIQQIVENKELNISLVSGARESFENNFNMKTNIAPLIQLLSDYAGRS